MKRVNEVLSKEFINGIVPVLSVIYVNYNSMKLILASLNSVKLKTKETYFEVLIVDNASVYEDCREIFVEYSNMIELLHDNKMVRITLILSPENLGFGKGNNLAVKYSVANVLFFLNPDTLLVNDAIDILYNSICTIPNCGAVGPNLYDENMKPNYSYSRFNIGILADLNRLFVGIIFKFLKNVIFNTTGHLIRVKMIMGASLMLKRELFENSYFFDPDFNMFFEETEMCKRISSQGFEMYNIPQAKIIHFEGGSFVNASDKRDIMYLEARKIYYKKIYSPSYKKVSDIIVLLTYLSKIIIHSYNSNKRKMWISKFLLLKKNI